MPTRHDVDDEPTTTSPRGVLGVLAGGFFMGSAELVPGVSGGTIALVFGIYDRLIEALSQGAGALGHLVRGQVDDGWRRLRHGVDWPFVVALLGGMGMAILALSSVLEHLLETQAVLMSALFAGLVAGSVVLARRELHAPLGGADRVLAVAVAALLFMGLGLTPGRITDPTLVAFYVAAAIAICAMVLPGVSGSFILLLLGMYDAVIGAVTSRDLVVLAVFAAGMVTGLGLFSTGLRRLLDRRHDRTLAVLLGLMAGSLRVLWPWPSGPEGVGDARLGAPVPGEVPAALGAAVVGIVVVVAISWIGRSTVGNDGGPRSGGSGDGPTRVAP